MFDKGRRAERGLAEEEHPLPESAIAPRTISSDAEETSDSSESF